MEKTIKQTGVQRSKRIVAVLLAFMMVFVSMPTMAFAAEGDITVYITIKNDTFTTPLISDAGNQIVPKWTGTIYDRYPITVKKDQSLADAILEDGKIDPHDGGSPGSSYFDSFYNLKGELGLKHNMWGFTYDTTGWLLYVNGSSAINGPSGYINSETVNTDNYEVQLKNNDEITYGFTVDGADIDNPYLPESPANAKATAKAHDSIQLTWSKTDRADSYDVYRADSISGDYKKLGSSSTESYLDKTAKTGKTHFYKIRATRSAELQNAGDFSNVTSSKTTLKKTSLKVAKKGKKSAQITWKKIDGATKYQVYRAVKGSYKKVATVSGSKTKYLNKKLKKGTKYSYKVRAYKVVDGKIVYSGFSSAKSVKI